LHVEVALARVVADLGRIGDLLATRLRLLLGRRRGGDDRLVGELQRRRRFGRRLLFRFRPYGQGDDRRRRGRRRLARCHHGAAGPPLRALFGGRRAFLLRRSLGGLLIRRGAREQRAEQESGTDDEGLPVRNEGHVRPPSGRSGLGTAEARAVRPPPDLVVQGELEEFRGQRQLQLPTVDEDRWSALHTQPQALVAVPIHQLGQLARLHR